MQRCGNRGIRGRGLSDNAYCCLDKEKEEKTLTLLVEHSVGPGNTEKEEAPIIITDEPYEPPAQAAEEDLPVTHPESEREQPAEASLADAVEEIKRYIHAEIKALKAEIQLLQEQK